MGRLSRIQETPGATFAPESERPRDFGDFVAEYKAARSQAAVFDVHDRTQLALDGPGAADFLQGFCTNDVKSLAIGQGCEAFIPNIKGRILGHVFVFRRDEGLVLETVPGQQQALLKHLAKYVLSDDVFISELTDQQGELLLAGPDAASLLAQVFSIDADRWRMFQHADAPFGDGAASVRRVNLIGSPAYLVSLPRGRLDAAWRALVAAGAVPAGDAALETLRIEAGFPLYGRDISEENIAQEAARTGLAIDFQKGCYLGQEPIARLDAMGHTNRELRLLVIEGNDVPALGSAVLGDGAQVGTLTSAGYSPGRKACVGLGTIKSKFNAPGTQVDVAVGESTRKAEVLLPLA